jgi:paraquat-inducible protein B
VSIKAKPTVIGAFVVGAVALAVAGVLVFGSGTFLKERITYVAYFEGSISGLSVGAPVVFRGVKIGSVSDILVEFEPKDMSVRIPVIIEFEPERVTRVSGEAAPRKNMALMIERGLRAQLQLQSLVTGQLIVALDFYPDKPIRLLGVDNRYLEFPTIQTSMQELTKTLENLPLEELVNKLMLTVEGVERLVNSPEITESVRTLNETLKEVQVLTKNLSDKSGPITSNIEKTTKAATAALEQVDKTLYLVDDILAEDSEPRHELVKALKEVSAAARSVRNLADYLERHPEALIHGKGIDKGTQGRNDE